MIVIFDRFSSFFRSWSIFATKSCYSMDNCTIFWPNLRFREKASIPVAINRFFDFSSFRSVLFSTLSDQISEVSSISERVDYTHFIPEKIIGIEFFPKVTTIRIPILHNPIEVIFHKWPNSIFSLILFIVIH